MNDQERQEKAQAKRLAEYFSGKPSADMAVGAEIGKSYRPGAGFEEAILHLKHGRYVARRGWNGKGMFVFQGLPRVEVNHKPAPGDFVTGMDAADAFRAPYSGPCLCLMTAQKTIQVGWLATQSDMLAMDWEIVE